MQNQQRIEKNMKVETSSVQIPINNPVQIKPGMAKCPHGNPGGACPLCFGSGGGGALRDRIKPTAKDLGLKTWSDLLGVWYAMQSAKFEKQNNGASERLLAMQKALERTQIYQIINNFVNSRVKSLIKLLNSKLLQPAVKSFKQLAQSVKNFYQNLKAQVLQQINALSTINLKVQVLVERLFRSMDVFRNAMEKFLANYKEKEKAVKEFIKDMTGKFKKKLYRILEAAESLFNDKKRDEDENKIVLLEEYKNAK